jgi:LysM repeat protein
MLLVGCTSGGPAQGSDATATLRPYAPVTVTASQVAISTATIAIPTSGPSPTPFTHVVGDGDTMIGIAYRYGVSLEDLMAANPGVDPRYLSIGYELLIPEPDGDGMPGGSPLSTPVPITLTDPVCYRTLSDSMWCLMLAHNQTGITVESLQAVVFLVDAHGEVLADEFSYAPLNRLMPGGKLPMATFFPAPAPRQGQPVAQLVTALEEQGEVVRYLPLDLTLYKSEAGPDGRSWQTEGELSLRADEVNRADRVVVVVVAYSAEGELAGFAEWVSEAGLDPGTNLPFEVMLVSLGPPVERAEVLIEAQSLP